MKLQLLVLALFLGVALGQLVLTNPSGRGFDSGDSTHAPCGQSPSAVGAQVAWEHGMPSPSPPSAASLPPLLPPERRPRSGVPQPQPQRRAGGGARRAAVNLSTRWGLFSFEARAEVPAARGSAPQKVEKESERDRGRKTWVSREGQ